MNFKILFLAIFISKYIFNCFVNSTIKETIKLKSWFENLKDNINQSRLNTVDKLRERKHINEGPVRKANLSEVSLNKSKNIIVKFILLLTLIETTSNIFVWLLENKILQKIKNKFNIKNKSNNISKTQTKFKFSYIFDKLNTYLNNALIILTILLNIIVLVVNFKQW